MHADNVRLYVCMYVTYVCKRASHVQPMRGLDTDKPSNDTAGTHTQQKQNGDSTHPAGRGHRGWPRWHTQWQPRWNNPHSQRHNNRGFLWGARTCSDARRCRTRGCIPPIRRIPPVAVWASGHGEYKRT